jgi:hypothetical protein
LSVIALPSFFGIVCRTPLDSVIEKEDMVGGATWPHISQTSLGKTHIFICRWNFFLWR